MMISPERIESLQGQWLRLVALYGVTPVQAYPVFDRLVSCYSEPHRHYHTLEHLSDVLRVMGRLNRFATHPAAVSFAAWFHDAVYDPRSRTNEADSAHLARELLAPWSIPDLDLIESLILATAHRTEGRPSDNEVVLLDADLAILAAPEFRYRRYASDIRREYGFVEDREFAAGRIAVLNGFLTRPSIFSSALMREEGEVAARANLTSEIERLKG